jgi:hypothetical protein
MKLVLSTIILASVSCGAMAQETVVEKTESHRTTKKLGSYLAVHDPAPAIVGINLAYNLTDFLRVSAGYGQLSVGVGALEASATTIGAGVTALVPGWSVSPAVGLKFASVIYSGNLGLDLGGFKESGSHVYGSLGVDWQASGGFNLAAGYNYSFKSGIGGSVYVAAGWFVDWLG